MNIILVNGQYTIEQFILLKKFETNRFVKFMYLNNLLQLVESEKIKIGKEMILNFKRKYEALNNDQNLIVDYFEKRKKYLINESFESNIELLELNAEILTKLILKLGGCNYLNSNSDNKNAIFAASFFEILVKFKS